MPLLVTALLALVTNMAAQAPAASSVDVTTRAAAIVAALKAKDGVSVEAQFDDKMKAAFPPGRIGAMWDGLSTQAGALRQCGVNVRVRAIADKQMVIQTCEFEHATFDFQLAFDRTNRVSGLVFRPVGVPGYRPPDYADPLAFTEREVTVGAAGWPLPGLLTVPAGAGPFPALVLVHGSGANDRDETVGPNKPFEDLALGLATRGVAVLRYDKRTKVFGERMRGVPSMTVKDEAIDDAVAAAAFLRTQPTIDPARVFVLGHSLGGMLVPRIAAADPRLAGAIVMAGPARPVEQAILAQTRYLALADGTITPEEQKGIDDTARLVEQIRALTPADAAAGTRILNAPAAYWLDLAGYDPPAAAKALTVPLFILQGERDYQVTMEDFARWKTALAGRAHVSVRSYPALNHEFLPGTGKSLPAEYATPSHVPQQVVDDIARWIEQ